MVYHAETVMAKDIKALMETINRQRGVIISACSVYYGGSICVIYSAER